MFLFPWSNFHELNLDWIIKQIKEFKETLEQYTNLTEEEIEKQIQELVDSGYFESLVDADVLDGISAKTKNIVVASTVKSKNPSLNDDALMDECTKQAQEIGLSAIIKWDIGTGNFNKTHVINGIQGIDFCFSVINIPDMTIDLFNLQPDNVYPDETVAASDFANAQITETHNNLYNKIFEVRGNSTKTYGVRNGGTEEITPAWLFISDGRGRINNFFPNSNYFPTEGNVYVVKVHDMPKNNMFIKNAILEYSVSSQNLATFIRCERSGSVIENIRIDGMVASSDEYLGTVFNIGHCFGVNVRNVYGNNPVQITNSGYVFSGYCPSDLRFENCVIGDVTQQGSWGSTGFNFTTNIYFEKCCMERFDNHYASWGNYVVRDCSCNLMTYGVGQGSIIVENVTFIGPNSDCIAKRADIGGFFEGSINISNCTVQNDSDRTRFFAMDYKKINTGSTINTMKVPGEYKISNIKFNGSIFLFCGVPVNADNQLNIGVVLENIRMTNTSNGILIGTSGIANYWRLFNVTVINSYLSIVHLLRGNVKSMTVINCEFTQAILTECATGQSTLPSLKLIGCILWGFVTNTLNLSSLIVIGCTVNTNANNNRNGVAQYQFLGNLAPPGGNDFWNATNYS